MRVRHGHFLRLLWNTGFIGAEFGLPYAGPFRLLFWRYLVLAAVLAVACGVRLGTLSGSWRSSASTAWTA